MPRAHYASQYACRACPFPIWQACPFPIWQACPFPSVVALLLHRIKADLAAEKRRYHLDLAATSSSSSSSTDLERRGSGVAAFAPAQIAEIAQIVQVVEEVLGSQACYPLNSYHPLTFRPPP